MLRQCRKDKERTTLTFSSSETGCAACGLLRWMMTLSKLGPKTLSTDINKRSPSVVQVGDIAPHRV